MLIVFALAQKIKEKGSVFNLKVCLSKGTKHIPILIFNLIF